MSARPVKDFLNRKVPRTQVWMLLFLVAAGLVVGGVFPFLGIGLGAGILVGSAILLVVEKREVEKKPQEEKKETKTADFGRL